MYLSENNDEENASVKRDAKALPSFYNMYNSTAPKLPKQFLMDQTIRYPIVAWLVVDTDTTTSSSL